MIKDRQQNTQETEQSPLSLSVLEKIEQEHVAQVPRWRFALGEYAMWALWALSVCFGAVAFSVIIFFLMHAGYAPYEVTHDDLFHFFLEVMPYVWVIVFVLMALIAHYNLRHTKRGYKFAVWQLLLSSIVVSFMGGVVLHTAGMGFRVDSFVAQRIPFFPAFHTFEAELWQSPAQGRMIGHIVPQTEESDVAVFMDAEGSTWKLDTRELNPVDLETLHTENAVRVVGMIGTSSEAYFYGCGVFPWMPDKNVSLGDLKRDRDRFILRMQAHHAKIMEELQATGTVPEYLSKPLCANHSAVLRIQQKFGQ